MLCAVGTWSPRVDVAALGKCGSCIGLVASSARTSSACEVPVVPVELAGGPNLKLAAILVTAVGPGNYLGLELGVLTDTRPGKRRLGATRARGVDPAGTMRVVWCCARVMRARMV